ncbi:MAG: MerR family transcriptional regulator [Treponemataceae bacterium]|nr:MerR family transcriptional regulator [Treponemataceae bacterium]
MAQFSIGEVEQLTGIKAHVLRYWEEVVPSITPKKDLSGRRVYSTRDVQQIMRLKYLIYEKKFTIEGARNQLIADIDVNSKTADSMQQLNEIRGTLLNIYRTLHKTNENTN